MTPIHSPSQPQERSRDDEHDQASIAVQVRGLVKSFGSGDTTVTVLKGIDLDVHFGELLLLVGESGGGKTTLLSAIAGILDIDAGDLTVLGASLTTMSSGTRTTFRGRTMGFIYQQFNLLPALTAAENVAIPLLIQGRRRNAAISEARLMLARVGLSDRTEFFPKNLSGGQQQRVAIARALVNKPQLLVCDEPTAALDGPNGQKIMELIRGVGRAPNRCVIVVTHDSRIFHFGDMQQLQVRAEVDTPLVVPHRAGVAYLKGQTAQAIPLTFVRIEPYIVPHKSLTGDNSERVDTRVLQIIYRFERPPFPIYAGQQVDVFIDRAPSTTPVQASPEKRPPEEPTP